MTSETSSPLFANACARCWATLRCRALRSRLDELGYAITDAELADCYALATSRADVAKEVTDRDLLSIIHNVRRAHSQAVADHSSAAAAP